MRENQANLTSLPVKNSRDRDKIPNPKLVLICHLSANSRKNKVFDHHICKNDTILRPPPSPPTPPPTTLRHSPNPIQSLLKNLLVSSSCNRASVQFTRLTQLHIYILLMVKFQVSCKTWNGFVSIACPTSGFSKQFKLFPSPLIPEYREAKNPRNFALRLPSIIWQSFGHLQALFPTPFTNPQRHFNLENV